MTTQLTPSEQQAPRQQLEFVRSAIQEHLPKVGKRGMVKHSPITLADTLLAIRKSQGEGADDLMQTLVQHQGWLLDHDSLDEQYQPLISLLYGYFSAR